jgi:hypothetical protein
MGIFIGVDPGLDGAIAAVDSSGALVHTCVMPVLGKKGEGKRLLDNAGLLEALRHLRVGAAGVALEVQQAMPGQGVSSMFAIGRGFGALEMAVVSCGYPMHQVRPQAWQKAMLAGTPDNMDTKARAALVCQRLWPRADLRASERARKAHEGIPDALLLAEWLRRKLVNGGVADAA